MAKALHGLESLSGLSVQTRTLHSVLTLRLVLGYVILLGAIVSTIGTSWDIQWHSFIGRDRTLIPPHIMMLSGLTLSGLIALVAVVIETLWVRRSSELAKRSTPFAGIFFSSLGTYVAGFAALNAAIAFPLDSYWHALYGIDVAIWAPFHVMILTAGAIVPLGAAMMLLSASQLATVEEDKRARRIGYVGAIIAFATMISIFTFLLADATDDPGFINLGSIIINLFPLLSCLLVTWALVTVKYVIPIRRAALYVILAYCLIGVLFEVFVPPATNALVAFEHLAYRKDEGSFAALSIIAVRFWYLAPLLVAFLYDRFFAVAQRKQWSSRKLTITLVLIGLIAGLPIVALIPIGPIFFVVLAIETGFIGFPLSMLLGLLGAFVGTWFGQRLGTALLILEGR